MRLTDNAWPANIQFMLIGQIDSVATRENQSLRYDPRIVPRARSARCGR